VVEEPITDVLLSIDYIQLGILYGSRAIGKNRHDSDVDIAVAAKQELTVDQRLEIHEQLERATGLRVELRDIHKLHGFILSEVLTKGKILVRKNPKLLAKFMIENVYFNEDMRPMLRKTLKNRIYRFIEEAE